MNTNRIQEIRAQIQRMREEMADEAKQFEARCELHHEQRVQRLAGRLYRCTECGKAYGAEWVAVWDLRCDVECDGDLVEVRNG